MVKRILDMLSHPVSARPKAFMGFDGFIDTVGCLSHGDRRPFSRMDDFGRFLIDRQESNCAIEVSRHERKLGGNMPICANALAVMGIPVSCVGAMGKGNTHPAFASMNPLCCLYPVAAPGECLAIEFVGSKLYLADMSGPRTMAWNEITESIGLKELVGMTENADLIGLFNWGELPNIQKIWEGFAREILPELHGRIRTAVFDLADCSGRSDGDILSAIAVLKAFKTRMRVVLSANDNELLAIARSLGFNGTDTLSGAKAVFASGAMDLLVHHSLDYARVIEECGVGTVSGIYVENPVLVTGGGDHFNAGLCLGMLCGLSSRECAQLGNTVSKLYVSTGKSPSLVEVLNELPCTENETFVEEGA